MSENLTSEEKALLAAQERADTKVGAKRGRKPAAAKEATPAETTSPRVDGPTPRSVPQEDAAGAPPAPRREAPVETPAARGEEPAQTAAVKEDAAVEATASTTPARGPLTPVQYGGDGWGDTPIQMRG